MVARTDLHDLVCAVLRGATLHAWAAAQPGAQAMQGRDTAWATRLPNGPEVVVRHSRHGGLLAPLTRDLFLAPTRAPRELEVSLRLRAVGVSTPDVLAYAVYTAAGPLCRADVVTARVHGVALPAAWASAVDPAQRQAVAEAVGGLLSSLRDARAHHPDLNARNVLIAPTGNGPTAWVLDVDRVQFGRSASDAAARNAGRLAHSLAQLRDEGALDLDAAAWRQIAGRAGLARTVGSALDGRSE
ncbi:MAG: lipopolysaccharide kinase InaA family protein [Gemmatimonadota bacterium]|nr:lipopolysaccharide kinase InaA family protein [Gemmatimonadota bacterium]